jgi:hypothetical protein
MALPLREILRSALAGENACAACGGAVPVASTAVELLCRLHGDGRLEQMEPEGVRMILVLGSLDAGCGIADADADGRLRVSCPRCSSPGQLARAATMSSGPAAAISGGRGREPAAALGWR